MVDLDDVDGLFRVVDRIDDPEVPPPQAIAIERRELFTALGPRMILEGFEVRSVLEEGLLD